MESKGQWANPVEAVAVGLLGSLFYHEGHGGQEVDRFFLQKVTKETKETKV